MVFFNLFSRMLQRCFAVKLQICFVDYETFTRLSVSMEEKK